jgi:hypothetical protein
MIKRALGCVALFGLMASSSLQAHHSLAGVYDMKKEMEKFDNRVGDDTRLRHGPRAEGYR